MDESIQRIYMEDLCNFRHSRISCLYIHSGNILTFDEMRSVVNSVHFSDTAYLANKLDSLIFANRYKIQYVLRIRTCLLCLYDIFACNNTLNRYSIEIPDDSKSRASTPDIEDNIDVSSKAYYMNVIR